MGSRYHPRAQLDQYTRETKEWLDRRYRASDADGVYLAHQPIYGFRAGHCEPDLIDRYIRTFAIMKALALGDFETLLDLGAAEGYKAHLARHLLGLKVVASDLSPEACARAREISHVDSVAADAHRLPFGDGSFDVVLCSETLEHVSDKELALSELLRVARHAVIITVPRDPPELIESVLKDHVPHGHIHRFDVDSFDYLETQGFHVQARPIIAGKLGRLKAFVEAAPRQRFPGSRLPSFVFKAYNLVQPAVRRLIGVRSAAAFVRLDDLASQRGGRSWAIICTIWKLGSYPRPRPIRRIRARDVLGLTVPLHYMRPKSQASDRGPRTGAG